MGVDTRKSVREPQYDRTLVHQMVAVCRWVCPPEIPGKRAVHSHPVGTGHWRKRASRGFTYIFLSAVAIDRSKAETAKSTEDPFSFFTGKGLKLKDKYACRCGSGNHSSAKDTWREGLQSLWPHVCLLVIPSGHLTCWSGPQPVAQAPSRQMRTDGPTQKPLWSI